MSSLRYLFIFVLSHLFFPVLAQVQILDDGYEADSGLSWTGVTCNVDTSYNNPVSGSFNTSATVMRYEDDGGQYAHVRLDVDNYLDIGKSPVFIMKIYIPSDGITGNSDNKVSVKLQNNNLNEPWNTQTEIIKPLVLDQWQEVIFDFKNDNYINFNGGHLKLVPSDPIT